jgi:hypothetical protein
MRSVQAIRPIALSVVVIAIGLLIAASIAVAIGPVSSPVEFPDAGLTEAERMAKVEAARERERQYVLDFEAGGADPRSLPRAYSETFAGWPSTLAEVAARADAAARGKVTQTHFGMSEDGLHTATSTIELSKVLKGDLGASVTVEQRGGPVPQPDGAGALWALSSDPLVLPGDELVILLRLDEAGTYRTLPGGTYRVANNKLDLIETTDPWTLGRSLEGMDVAVLEAELAPLLK